MECSKLPRSIGRTGPSKKARAQILRKGRRGGRSFPSTRLEAVFLKKELPRSVRKEGRGEEMLNIGRRRNNRKNQSLPL